MVRPACGVPAAAGPEGARAAVDLRPLRLTGAAMLGAGLVLPLLPATVGLPCPLRSLTGVPCPLCGMTRSVTAAVHGHWGDALALNPAGLVAVVAAVVLLAVRRPPAVRVPPWAPVAAVALLWAYQLWRSPVL